VREAYGTVEADEIEALSRITAEQAEPRA
jgi:hypothetical protein